MLALNEAYWVSAPIFMPFDLAQLERGVTRIFQIREAEWSDRIVSINR
jgi:hypothetical protein